MNTLLENLHDIKGIDPVSIWPLAIGWWVIIGIIFITLGMLIWGLVRWIAFKRSWRNDTFKKLNSLEKNLSEATARETVMRLSEYLRRIALKKFPRKECAALIGNSWLKWLKAHDPKQFDWEQKGTVLIEVPYAPLNQQLPTLQIKELIQAVKNWVR